MTTTSTEFKVTTNSRFKYFTNFETAYKFYSEQCAEYFEDFEQTTGAEMNLQTKDKKNTVSLKIITE